MSDMFPQMTDGGAISRLEGKLSVWEKELCSRLEREMPLGEHRYRLWFAELEYRTVGCPEAMEDDIRRIGELAPEERPGDWPVCDRGELIEKWRNIFENKFNGWQDGIVAEEIGRAMNEIGGWMDRLDAIRGTFEDLGVEPEVFWGTGVGSLCDQDVDVLRGWIERIRGDPKLRELCEELGRAMSENEEFREMPVQINKSSPLVPIVTSKEEIKGIELGSDAESIVPSEFLLMCEDGMSTLFDLKFAEGKLLCFRREGFDYAEDADESEIIGRPEKKRGGPIVICVDSSGSMTGAPENVAKAVAVSLSMMALSQRRRCYIINFSMKVDTMEFGGEDGMAELIDFLRLSFHGGTDVVSALKLGMSVINGGDYADADMLAVSDFFAPDAGETLRAEAESFRDGGNKIYSLSVGRRRADWTGYRLFDREYRFDPEAEAIATVHAN